MQILQEDRKISIYGHFFRFWASPPHSKKVKFYASFDQNFTNYAYDILKLTHYARVTSLEHAHDDLEQRGRCFCVRMKNIPVATDETTDKALKKVENILKEACPSLSGNNTDRAHRIGSNYKCLKTNNTCHSVIVCFNSFKHRTSFYWNRNKLKGVQIKLDLTKKK